MGYVTASADFKMNNHYLWKEIDLNLQKLDVEAQFPAIPTPIGNLTIKSVKADGNIIVKANTASKAVPKGDDLDYTKLGDKCTSVPLTSVDDMASFVSAQRMQQRLAAVLTAVAASTRADTLVV